MARSTEATIGTIANAWAEQRFHHQSPATEWRSTAWVGDDTNKLRLFNAGEYFEAHEALEEAWNEEHSQVRDLYRGILQIAVVYLHITRLNYNGAVKVYARSQKWLRDWPGICRGFLRRRVSA